MKIDRRIIGLAGDKGSGKDTVGRIIKSRDYRGVATLSFAEPLKAALAEIIQADRQEFEDPEFKENPLDPFGKTPRAMLENLGTDWARRYLGEDIWLTNLSRRMDRLPSSVHTVVITDVRFVNERRFIKVYRGQIWHVIRPDNPHNKIPSTHVSARGLPLESEDVVIVNGGDLNALERRVQELCRKHLRG